MMWALVIIVIGTGYSHVPQISVIDFPSKTACEEARDNVIESGKKVEAQFAVTCVQKTGFVP